MSQDWVQHIVHAKEELRSGARTGTQLDIERELRHEAEVEFQWAELCSALVSAVQAFNRLARGEQELELEGNNDDPWEGLIASRTTGSPARAEIRMVRGGIIECDMTWANIPQGRITASPEETPDGEGLFHVTSQRPGFAEYRNVHLTDLPERLLSEFFRHV